MRADAAASGAGLKVERVIRIEEQRAPLQPPVPMMMAERAGMAAQAAPPVAPGELEVHANVTMTATIR